MLEKLKAVNHVSRSRTNESVLTKVFYEQVISYTLFSNVELVANHLSVQTSCTILGSFGTCNLY